MEFIDSICERTGLSELERIKPLQELAQKVGMKASHFGLSIIALISVLAIFRYGSTFISFSVGFLYPAYMSFKAIETRDNRQEDRLWLTYWVVFGLLYVADDFFGIVLSFLPLYNILKVCFYVWLFHPKTKGALTIYDKVVKGVFKRYEPTIDSGLEKLKEKVDEAKPLLADATQALRKETKETKGKIKDE